jgi:hypothetical protein
MLQASSSGEFLNFLKVIDAQVPEGLDIRIVMDNYATYKTPKIKAWLARPPHYHFLINQVERWCACSRESGPSRYSHRVGQLEADIRAIVDRHNHNPRPSNGPNLPTNS